MTTGGNNSWQETADRLSQLLKDVTPSNVHIGFNEELSQLLKSAVNDTAAWPNDRRVFTFGQMDTDKCILLCRSGAVPWWMPLTGRVIRGEMEETRKLYDAYIKEPGHGEKLDISPVLTWVANPSDVAPGSPTKRSPEMIKQLLKWGADPNYGEGKWLEYALRKHEPDCIRPLLEHGGSTATVQRVMDALQKEQNFAQLGRIQQALTRTGFLKVDEQTLMEAKYVPDAKGMSVFKTLFNFRSRRVQEIYETGAGAQAVVNAVRFDDYDPEALREARETLIRLGGAPRELEGALDKPKTPKAALRKPE